ncbi:MAG: carbohydrate binding domain-containing protein [Flavobacterium sp.]|uniref:carbohydrate binding domain-containing protein n=1 Tax=Flavobacterium sp. TaxID=239 RepID=UPI00263412C2|nr:carbohydrate binding domain-containing protein [Flavobacterium sp.]MDD5149486.1 carbohydrate binding domain-containing protein [Flavobacterium sp.]
MKKLLVLFILPLCQISFAQTNLVKNGGFEMELTNWRGDVATLSPYDKKSGKNSCAINQFVGAEWKGIDQIMSFPKTTAAIELSGWIKSAAIENGENEWNTGKFDIEFLNSSEKGIENQSIASVLGTTPWTFYKKTIPVPAGASKLRIMLALGQTNGSIFFDDIKAVAISLEQLNKIHEEESAKTRAGISTNSESKPIELTNGNFENGIESWRGNASVSTSIFKEGKAALILNSDTFDWTGIDQIADVPENATSITLSGWLKSDNIKQGKDPWNNGLFNVEFIGNDNQKTSDDQNIAFVTGTSDWTYYTKTFTLPSGTKKYRIMLALGFASGTLYADEISVSFK